MFDPGFKADLPPVSTSDYRSSQNIDTRSWRPPSNTRIIETLDGVSSTAIDSTLLVVLVVVSLILIVLCVWYFRKKRGQMKKDFSTSSSAQLFTNDENRTATDLNTFVNTSVGISKHAALEIPSEFVAVVKKIATGGGAGVFLAKLMDSNLAKKHGEDVIQKRVFIKSKLNEEAFYQEVGIMVMLSSFPHFCSIIGYTLDPMAIILKFYPDGSLANFIKRRSYGLSIALKASMDVAQALSIMHSHSLAHCDIKPHNILIEINNRNISFVLTDFGITQVLSEKVIAAKMFHTVNLRGLSVNYASPEAFVSYRSKHYTRVNYTKYDIFSYACIIYELLVKSTPWSRQ
jgi:tRNA A-37 threonylcarbamoyl transferase component Bud32